MVAERTIQKLHRPPLSFLQLLPNEKYRVLNSLLIYIPYTFFGLFAVSST